MRALLFIFGLIPLGVAKRIASFGFIGELMFAASAARTMHIATQLLRTDDVTSASRLLMQIARLDSNRPVRELVDEARRTLESLGIPAPQSDAARYDSHLMNMSDGQRHIHLARQLIYEASSTNDPDIKRVVTAKLREHLLAAERITKLGRKERIVLDAIRGGQQANHEA